VLLPLIIPGIALQRPCLPAVSMAVLLLSDLLDGRIARPMKHAGAFDKTLDSTVDLVLIYSLFIALYAGGVLATYQFVFFYLAMLTILSLQFALSAAGRGEQLLVTTPAKTAGALQCPYLPLLIAREVTLKGALGSLLDVCLFALLSTVIVLNSAECLLTIRTLRGVSVA